MRDKPEHASAFDRFNTPAVKLSGPPRQPPTGTITTMHFDGDPLERLASQINALSPTDSKRLLKMLVERLA